jgi:cation-transporting P-type ATPase I
MQTLVDSNSRAVVVTTLGSFAVMVGVISTPGVSQLFGCTPVSPLGWGQGFFAATLATGLSAFAPGLLERVVDVVRDRLPSVVDDHDDPSATETAQAQTT